MQDVRYILVVDTALNGCGIALYDSEQQAMVFDVFEDVARGQSERVIPMIEEQLGRAELCYRDIGLICGITGPGSFAGIRVGLSVVRSLSLALDVPAVGVSSMEAVMLQVMEGEDRKLIEDGHNLYVIIESKRSDYYVQRYSSNVSTNEIFSTITGCFSHEELVGYVEGEIKSPVFRGDAVSRFLDDKTIVFNRLDLSCVCRYLSVYQEGDEFGCVSQAIPTYFRGADVSVSKKKYRMVEKVM